MRSFEVRSPTANRGEQLPFRYSDEKHGGENHSIPLHMDGLPPEAQSVAFALVDLDANDFVHWMVVDVPADGHVVLPEDASRNAMPPGARELYNFAGFQGYEGPDPPPRTGVHRYQVLAYALDTASLDIPEHADVQTFMRSVEGHAVAQGENYWVFPSG